MSETTHRDWQRWRIAPVKGAKRTKAVPPFERMAARLSVPPAPDADADAPAPAADGIRHELVARVRAEIAAGTYDTEEKWALAEEALLRRIEGRA
jgi:Anti-sigma-28 factor, FlgM